MTDAEFVQFLGEQASAMDTAANAVVSFVELQSSEIFRKTGAEMVEILLIDTPSVGPDRPTTKEQMLAAHLAAAIMMLATVVS